MQVGPRGGERAEGVEAAGWIERQKQGAEEAERAKRAGRVERAT